MSGSGRLLSSGADDVFKPAIEQEPASSRRFDIVAADNAVQRFAYSRGYDDHPRSVTTFRELSSSRGSLDFSAPALTRHAHTAVITTYG